MTKLMLITLFTTISNTHGLPPGLLSALCFVESSHRTAVVNHQDGGSPSYGVCQIKLETAQSVGYKGTAKNLKDPAANIWWAGKYLKYQLKRYKGDPRKAISAYNAGTHRINDRGLTKNRKYVKKVFVAWSEDR